MENGNAHIDEMYKARLKQNALPYLPHNLGDVDAQRQILSMITCVVPSAASCLEQADLLLWPKVNAGELPIGRAIAQCAYECNNILSPETLHDLHLDTLPREHLMKAWIALDYYCYVLKVAYSGNIRNLQQQITAVLVAQNPNASQQKASVTSDETVPENTVPHQEPITPVLHSGKGAHSKDFITAFLKSKDNKKQKAILLAALVLLIILASVLLFNDTARTERAIRRIGTVTIESEEAILHAEELYDGLAESHQENVDNYENLVMARAEYERLETEAAIDKIGKVSLESKDAIEYAEKLYAALSADAKKLVKNHKALTEARKEYDRMDTAVKKASDAIDAIGTVTLESGDKIKEARNAYDALKKDDLQKHLTQKLPTLTGAEKEFSQLHSKSLYDTGISLYKEKKYTEAIASFDTIIADYSDTELLGDARKAKADCQTAIANQAYKKKDYYTALKTLDSVETEYQQLENHVSLRNKVNSEIKKARPKNGDTLAGSIGWGRCYFKVTAGDQDMVLKIQNTKKTSKYELIYLRAGQKKTIKVADGNYSVKWASGEQYFDKTHLFGDDTVYRNNGTVDLETTYKGNKVYFWTVTLDFAVNKGTLITADQF